MRKLLLYIFTLMMLFTSSCTMKRVMWESMGVENSISAKAHLPSFDQIQNTTVNEVCAGKNGSIWDEPELIPSTPFKASLLLFFILFIFPWALFRNFSQQQPAYTSTFCLFPYRVPLYLKLRRLIYYF